MYNQEQKCLQKGSNFTQYGFMLIYSKRVINPLSTECALLISSYIFCQQTLTILLGVKSEPYCEQH